MHSKPDIAPISFEAVQAKFGREPMSVREFAAYISGNQQCHLPDITEKSVRNYIKTICENSRNLLTTDDFKNSDRQYELQPQYHALLLTLIDTDYFDGRKNDRRVSTRAELYNQLIKNIENYLPEGDKEFVMAAPSYPNAVLEAHLSNYIETELSHILRTLYHTDVIIRHRYMTDFLNRLIAFRKTLDAADSRATATRITYSHELDDLTDAQHQHALFEANSLDHYLIAYLAAKVHGKEYQYVPGDEDVSPESLVLAMKLFNLSSPAEDINDILKNFEAIIENHEKYICLKKKIENALDLADPVEHDLYLSFIQLVQIHLLRPVVPPDAHERVVRYIETCIADDKWDLINKFVQKGRPNYSEEQLQKILEAKLQAK